jgi:hypothetical protein
MGTKIFCCTEQCYFAAKAEFCGDIERLDEIMKQKDGGQSLIEGKKIRNLSKKNWEEVEIEVMKKVNREKYIQNPALKAILLATNDSILAEASPRDKRWGIGFPLHGVEKEQRQKWGDNNFGKVLMSLRSDFKAEPAKQMLH